MSLSGNEQTGVGYLHTKQAYAGFAAKGVAAAAVIIGQVKSLSRFVFTRVFGRVN